MTVADTIKQTVTTNNVVLFMKGTKSMPQCGVLQPRRWRFELHGR